MYIPYGKVAPGPTHLVVEIMEELDNYILVLISILLPCAIAITPESTLG